MSLPIKMMRIFALVASAAIVPTGGHAQSSGGWNGNIVIQRPLANDLPIIQNQQQRQNFQLQQQIYRDLDRQAVRPSNPVVPQVRPCQSQVYQNQVICR